MTLYDLWLSLLQMWLRTLTFCKNHPTVPGLIYLIFKQNSIRKIINKQLPKKFRDTVDADILEIKDDIKEIKREMGIEECSSLQLNGLKTIPIPLYRRFFLFLQTVTQHQKRRMSMLTNILKANLSKKLISALVAIGVTALNQKFGLNLSENDVTLILGLSLAHISLQTIIDSVKAWGLSKSTTIVHEVVPLVQGIVEMAIVDPNTTYQDMFPTIKTVHEGINKILADVQKNDGSQLVIDGMQAYTDIKTILEKYKHPQPLPEVQQESA